MPTKDDVPLRTGHVIKLFEHRKAATPARFPCLSADVPARSIWKLGDPLPNAATILKDPARPLLRRKIELHLCFRSGPEIFIICQQVLVPLGVVTALVDLIFQDCPWG